MAPYRVNTEYSIHWVLHYTCTAYTEYCIIPRSTVNRSQQLTHLSSLMSQFVSDLVVINSLLSDDVDWTTQSSVSSCSPSILISHLQIDHLNVLIQSRSITATKLTLFWPPCGLLNHLVHCPVLHLWVQCISIVKSICKLSWACPLSASESWHNHRHQVYLVTGCVVSYNFTWRWHSSSSPTLLDSMLKEHL